jgi:ribonuclease BN (tRNA processing enzyme)
MVEIKFLGTGNAFCPNGRLHSLVLVDGWLLVDAPPTVIPQMRAWGIDPASIRHLLITHWHGDHTFGLPFLLLERKYISDRVGMRPLTIHCHSGGEARLRGLNELAYPGTLTQVDWIEFNEGAIEIDGWQIERFEVCHEPATEPFGYRMEKDGNVLVHCGDSGPCEGVERMAGEADLMIVEMGIPDVVQSPWHHTPSDLRELALRHPETRFIATHNFVDGQVEFEMPSNVQQANDGDVFQV